jgi:hypothetical protein
MDVAEPQFQLARETDGSLHSGFGPNPENRLRRTLDSGRKAAQAKVAMEAGYPFVLVLARTYSELEFMPHYVIGAMFGTPMISFTFDDDPGRADPIRMVFGQGARLQESLNTRFSAVAVVSGFNPGLRRVEQIAESRMHHDMNPMEKVATFINTVQKEQEKGAFQERDEIHRLEIFHNPFASILLSMEFAGPFDDQWTGNRQLGIYYEGAWGTRGSAVPGRTALKV